MRRPDVWFAIALLGAAGAALADPVDLKPFRATYSADWKGMTAATSVLELKRGAGDTYVYETVNTPKGVFRMALPDSLTQASTFRLSEGHVVPLEYRGSDEKERPIDLKFDWQAKRVRGTAKDSAVDLEIPATAQDPMSLQIASLRNLAKGTLQNSVALVDGDGKLKDYELRQEGTAQIETALGPLETIVYTSRRAGSDRMTRSWVAPALGYLPVKAERIRKGKVEFTLRIESMDK
jgi:hypothetical protein